MVCIENGLFTNILGLSTLENDSSLSSFLVQFEYFLIVTIFNLLIHKFC